MPSIGGLSRHIAGSPHYKWWAFVAVAIGMFVSVMEQTGVNLALPQIADDLDLDIPTVQWITLGHILSTSVLFMPLGRMSDMWGRTRVYSISFLVFMAAAVAGGSAPTFPVLIGAKIVQGAASAGIQANAMAMTTDAFPERERGKAVGLYTTVVGAGAATGPVIGGLLISGFGWRSIFFANVPLGMVAVASVLLVLKDRRAARGGGPKRLGFDWVGAGFSSGGLVSLLLGMSNAHRFGWGSAPILASFLLAGTLFTVFIWWERRADDPMLDLTSFRSKPFSIGVSARFMLFLANSPVRFLMPFYLIQGLNYRAHIAGILIVPAAVSMGASGAVSGRLSDRVGARWLMLIGLALFASAMFIFSRLDLQSSPVHVIVGLILSGSGLGTFYSANTSAILGSEGRERYGIVSAFLNLTRTSGNVTGIALATTIVTFVMGSSGFEPTLAVVTAGASEGVKTAFMSGVTKVFLTSGSLVLLALVALGLQGGARRREPSLQGAPREAQSSPHIAGEE